MKSKDKATKEKEKLSKLPAGGGSYKRFCFAVLGDDEAVERVKSLWSWENQKSLDEDVEEEDSSSEEESESEEDSPQDGQDQETSKEAPPKKSLTIQQKAKRFGFRALPMYVFQLFP